MIENTLSTVFRVSVVVFLLGGLAIVTLQAGGLIAGSGSFVTGAEESLAPYAYGAAGVAGLLAFALSYFRDGAAESEDGVADTLDVDHHESGARAA
ncbi:hypothetical protein ACXVUM_08755 [Williamsia sp. SKLECPSW1]